MVLNKPFNVVISLPDLLMVRSLPVGAAVQILHILLSSADSGLWSSPSQNHGRRGLWVFRNVKKLAEKFHLILEAVVCFVVIICGGPNRNSLLLGNKIQCSFSVQGTSRKQTFEARVESLNLGKYLSPSLYISSIENATAGPGS